MQCFACQAAPGDSCRGITHQAQRWPQSHPGWRPPSSPSLPSRSRRRRGRTASRRMQQMGGSKLRRLWEGSMVFDWRRLFSLPARMETFLLSGSVSRTGENITQFLVFGKVHLFAQVKAKCVVTRSQVTRMPFHCLSDVETLKSNLTFIRHLTRNWALLSLWQKARFCFNASPSRVNVNCNHGWALRRAIR